MDPTTSLQSPEEFAKAIKAKYPQYAKVDDFELARMVLEKYPVYQNKVQNPDRYVETKELPPLTLSDGERKKIDEGNILDKAGVYVDKGIRSFQQSPAGKVLGGVVGGAAGLLGGALGGTIGGTLETGQQINKAIQGEGFDIGEIAKSTADTAKSTAQFGYNVGREAPPAALMGELGFVPNAVMGAAQLNTGIKTGKAGIEENDPMKTFQGAVDTAFGVLGTVGAIGSLNRAGEAGARAARFSETPIRTGFGAATRELGSEAFLKPGAMQEFKTGLGNLKEAASDIKDTAKSPFYTNRDTALNESIEGYRSAINPMKSDIRRVEIKNSKDLDNVLQFLAEEKVIPVKDSQGKLYTVGEADRLTSQKKVIDSKLAGELDNTYQKNSLDRLGEEAKADIAKRESNAEMLKKKIEDVDSLIASEKARYRRDLITDLELHRVKSGMWTVGYDMNRATLSPTARKIGNIAKTIIERNNADNVNVRQLNQVSGLYSDAIALLESVHGNVVKGGRLGGWFSQMMGAFIVDKVLGKVPGVGRFSAFMGSIIGKRYNEFLNDPERVVQTALKSAKKALLDSRSQKAIKEFERRTSQPKPPAPKLLGPGPIAAPDYKGSYGPTSAPPPMQVVPAAKTTGRTPGTGQFKRVFLSGPEQVRPVTEGTVVPPTSSPIPPRRFNNVVEALNDSEFLAKLKAARGNKLSKASENLYHTTPKNNLESIAKNGLTVGSKPRFEGVSGKGKISLSANEKGAEYYGGSDDVMIRVKKGYKVENLDVDPLAGGEGTYTTTNNIPPEALEVKIDGKWKPLKAAEPRFKKTVNRLPIDKLLDMDGDPISETIGKIPKNELSVTKGPIEVIKAGDTYLVLDGQHRASQALKNGSNDIDVKVLSLKEAKEKYGERWPQVFELE